MMTKFSFFDLVRKVEPKKTPRFVKDAGLLWESKVYYSKYQEIIEQLNLVAVTGTDGKTTTSTMIYEILKKAGFKVGLITTISAKIGDNDFDTGFHVTTPSPRELFKYLAMMRERGVEIVVLEVTAHAIAQQRINGLKFDTVVFTNITNHEHLDYFKSYKKYLGVKGRLLSKNFLKKGGSAILNKDDGSHQELLKIMQKRTDISVYSYSVPKSEFTKLNRMAYPEFNFEFTDHTCEAYTSETPDIKLKTIGGYNISNALAAICTARSYKIGEKTIVQALNDFEPPLGRMNIIQSHPFYAIVDFAHTPNALMQALTSARNLLGKKGKLICIFGCASERDETKRPIMGEIANQFADLVLLVPEDPRYEDLKKINKEIVGKIKSDKFRSFNDSSIESRREAIKYAMTRIATPGDVVIALGKGHEKSINIKGIEYPWSDSEEMKKYVKI